jgi:hypothetical protein
VEEFLAGDASAAEGMSFSGGRFDVVMAIAARAPTQAR